jgi:beta-glucosidase
MADINVFNPSPIEEADVKHIDIKQQPAIQVQPVISTPTLTPALTPDEDDLEAMAGKKVFTLEKPDDRAKELAAKLTLEQQVGFFFCTL